MKFIKLKLKNFKPYYGEQEINLYDSNRKNKNITLNIGQTGFGKTSISEAILWCIFGEQYLHNWKDWVNLLAIEIGKQKKEDGVDMSVELIAEIEGEKYRIIRNGVYDIERDRVKDSTLSIIHNGEPINNPEGFISDNFLTTTLMGYFVFNAEDLLKKFEDNKEAVIKDHINKIVGVETIDKLIDGLNITIASYKGDIHNIENQISGITADNIKTLEDDKNKKEEAIKKLEDEIKKLDENRKALLPKGVDLETKQFKELVDKRDNLDREIKDLNEKFKRENLIPNIDLLLLTQIINGILNKLKQKQTTKDDFDTSVTVIKSTLKDNYSGIFFSGEQESLIKKGVMVDSNSLDKIDNLPLIRRSGEETKISAINTFQEYKTKIQNLKEEFDSYKNDFKEKSAELSKIRNKINQIGETTRNMDLKKKYEEFNKIESNIKEKEENKKEIEEIKKKIEEEIIEKRRGLNLDEQEKKKIEKINKKIGIAKKLLEIYKKTKKDFLSDLLSYINENASKFLRNAVKDSTMFHSIEVNSSYQFTIKRKNGVKINIDDQSNRGHLQIALMAFFFKLSDYLPKKLPYAVDNPIMRLDPGHDRRLIEQLGKTADQLIFHIIPGKEYTSDSFKWLKNNLNTQNWIYREKYGRFEEYKISYIKPKDADKIIGFNIEEF